MNKLHLPIIGLFVLLFTQSAFAQNSQHDGAWVCDPERSSWSDGKFPRDIFSLTINITMTDDKITYASVNDSLKPKMFHTNYETTLDGADSVFEGQARFNQVAVQQLREDEFEILKKKDGDVIVGEYWTFRPDGKTLVRRGVAKSPEGISKAYEEFFVRN